MCVRADSVCATLSVRVRNRVCVCVRVYVYVCVRWICLEQVHVDPGASVFAATFIIVKLTMPVRALKPEP